MPGSQTNAIVDNILTDLSNKINPIGYISEMILPTVEVKQTTGLLGAYGSSHIRLVSSIVNGKSNFNNVDTRSYSTQQYNIELHGLSDLVTEQDRANVERPFDAEIDTTDELTGLLWTDKEKQLADALGSTSVLTNNTTLSGTDQYNDYAASDPLGDFATARSAVYSNVGIAPDLAIMDWATAEQLRYHPQLLDSLGFKEQRPGGLTTPEFTRALNVQRVLIGSAVYNSAAEGQADSIEAIWGKNVVFAVAPTESKKRQVSLGYRFQQFGTPRKVTKMQSNERPGATKIFVEDSYQQLISNADAAYLIKDAVA
jgi:hypothetical protein